MCNLILRDTCRLLAEGRTHLKNNKPEHLAVASIARDDPSTLPGDDPFPRARMQRNRNAR